VASHPRRKHYGGYVAQSTGDGIFALFGAPMAHEDHPQRALHAALAMQEELRRYTERMHRLHHQAQHWIYDRARLLGI
jgi:class 3 adenylate cyclase